MRHERGKCKAASNSSSTVGPAIYGQIGDGFGPRQRTRVTRPDAFPGRDAHCESVRRGDSASGFAETITRQFLSGRAINIWLMTLHLEPHVDSLAGENVLLLSCGLLAGTPAPSSSRLHVSAVLLLTGLLGSSNVGVHFGAELRAADLETVPVRRPRGSHGEATAALLRAVLTTTCRTTSSKIASQTLVQLRA